MQEAVAGSGVSVGVPEEASWLCSFTVTRRSGVIRVREHVSMIMGASIEGSPKDVPCGLLWVVI